MWQGLQHVTDYISGNTANITNTTTSLPEQLNKFYSRFETSSSVAQRRLSHTQNTKEPPLTVSAADAHKALRKINPRKAAGPENIPRRALGMCATELSDVFTSISDLSLAQAAVPTCFKTTTVIPQRSPVTYLNDYRPVALSPPPIIRMHVSDCSFLTKASGWMAASAVTWCDNSNLALNTGKKKEVIVDMRKKRRPHSPLTIRELEVGSLADDLTWAYNVARLVEKVQQWLHFLTRLRKFCMSPGILGSFYRCIILHQLHCCVVR